jgi:hypothetical protein
MPLTQVQSGMMDSTAQYYSFKNRIINGAMVIDQRNAGAAINPATNNAYCVDRWLTNTNVASKYSVQQNAGSVTPPTGFTYYLGATSLSAYSVGSSDSFALVQKIEGYNFADLDFGKATAKTVTISFWVRSSLTGTFGGSLTNGAIDRSYPFTYTVSSANTWEQKSVTIAGDTSGTWLTTNGIGAWLWFGLGMGSTLSGTAGAWAGAEYRSATGATSVVGTNGATFYITGVQLEKGSTATSFDYRPYGTELQLCQRYYHKPNFSDTSSNVTPYVLLQCSGSTQLLGPYMLPVTMRSTPTLTYSGLIATTANNGNAGSLTSLTLDSASTQSFRLIAGVASGLVAGNASFIQRVTTSDFMAFSAEL